MAAEVLMYRPSQGLASGKKDRLTAKSKDRHGDIMALREKHVCSLDFVVESFPESTRHLQLSALKFHVNPKVRS